MLVLMYLVFDLIETTGKQTAEDTVPLLEDGNLDSVLGCTSPGRVLLSILAWLLLTN